MSNMRLEANVLDYERDILTAYFYATDDVEYVLDDAIERAEQDGIDDYCEIIVTPFDPTDDEFEDPLGRWAKDLDLKEFKEE